MTQSVTFDTNVLDLVCRPERSPKDPRQPLALKVHQALEDGRLEGRYSVTLLTIEGVMKRDRAKVYSGTTLVQQPEKIRVTKNADLPAKVREKVGDADVESIDVVYRVDQPDRQPLPPEFVNRIKAAKELGFKVLDQVPRLGAFVINDPTGEFYLSAGASDEDIKRWNERACDVGRQIEARGLGMAQVKALGFNLAAGSPQATWWDALDQAPDIHAQRAIERAFAEWADADAIAAHIAYGVDIFCSGDVGNSNATNSIFDPANRTWLASAFGVKFMTLEDLAASLQ